MMDRLPKDDIIFFLSEIVEALDLSAFECSPAKDSRGPPGDDPGIMALLLYAYCQGKRSSRKVEGLCVRDISYRVVSAQLFPDHTSIAWFRKQHGMALEDLYPKILLRCKNAGLAKLGRDALDGSKVNAAMDDNRTIFHRQEEVKG